MGRGVKKNAKTSNVPKSGKKATHQKDPEGYQHLPIAWHLQHMDSGGNWPCTIQDIEKIKSRLHEYEKLMWHEVLKSISNHPMPTDKISGAAQRRLKELKHTDAPSLYQLEIKGGSGKQRLWGIRRQNVFKILWWDPKHTVYPTRKKRT